MKSPSIWRQPKRIVAMAVVYSMLFQTAMPAYAVVSQLPGVYVAQPEPNVMFTLDDSGSMSSDVIPDLPTNLSGFPGQNTSAVANTYFGGGYYCTNRDRRGNCTAAAWSSPFGTQFPLMFNPGSGFLNATYYADSNVSRFLRSSASNPLYYDHTVTYTPWPDAADNKSLLPPADPESVKIDSDDPRAATTTLNIKAQVTTSGTFWPATYYIFDVTKGTYNAGDINDPLNINTNFTKVEIQSGTPTYSRPTKVDSNGATVPDDGRTDCGTGLTCSYAQELQNFANWLQYYRNRMLMAKGGVASAFAKQGSNLRTGFGTINAGIGLGVRLFDGTDRTAFFNRLYSSTINGGTPLREAMDRVGKYFQTTDSNNPWAFTPGTTLAPEYDCRRSFHILSTDGFWNGNGASSPANGDNDAFTGLRTPQKPDGTTDYAYSDSATSTSDPLVSRFTINPFLDNASSQGDKLSDVAAYYWRTDLRGAIANNVSSSARDPAFWQHLTTFTVGLGITGTGTVTSNGSAVIPASVAASAPFLPAMAGLPWLATEATREATVKGKIALNWPDVTDNAKTTGDDLIRSAMVGRGRYFSATNPTALAKGLASALAEATDVPLSLANLASSSSRVAAGNKIYQATFNPAGWYGRLYSFTQAADGSLTTTPSSANWEASHKMPAPTARNIYTWDGAASAPSTFTWSGLNTTQKTDLNNSSDLLDYLRGSDAQEAQNGGAFRERTRYTPTGSSVTGGVLGDIVNGSPIKGIGAGATYESLPAGTPGKLLYPAYRNAGNTAITNMLNSVFVSANDGMLHAFNSEDGVERFAYVPNSVFSVPRSISGTEKKLQMLSDPGYAHRFTVDGPPQLSDAYFGDSDANGAWRTVLNGSTGAGARSIFTMDVTNPAVETGGFSASKILWEFSEANNIDMGYILSYGHVARMKNNKWALIFGNGYDSTNGQAKLFILDLYTGSVIREIAVGAAGGNGLSQPNFTLKDRVVEYIYAGDLKGNLWKIDATSSDPNQWAPSFGSAPEYAPLFTTTANQPITVMPTIGFRHPNGGNMISFGTGKLFEAEDTANNASTNVNLTRQAIYGIWDKPSETTGFSGTTLLQAQTDNTGLAGATDASLGGTSANIPNYATQRGWYMLLQAGGERVNVNPQIPNPNNALSPLFVVANTPAEALPCESGGKSRIFAFDVYTGAVPSAAVFDANKSGTITAADRGYNVWSLNSGIMTQPLFQSTATSGSTSTVSTGPEVWGDGRSGARDGGREDNGPAGPCGANIVVGLSDTSAENRTVSLCGTKAGRISWRQIQ